MAYQFEKCNIMKRPTRSFLSHHLYHTKLSKRLKVFLRPCFIIFLIFVLFQVNALSFSSFTFLEDGRKLRKPCESNRLETSRAGCSSTNGDKKFLNLNGYTQRPVPSGVSRFDFPWIVPSRVKFLSLKESNNRVLYSPIKERARNGLGHNMATLNGEIWTALRLNLTYTHRLIKFAVNSIPFNSERNIPPIDPLSRPFLHSGSIEQLFGWGVNEIPREHVQQSICPMSVVKSHDMLCRVCNSSHMLLRRQEILEQGLQNSPRLRYAIPVENVIELPRNISYAYPYSPRTENVIDALNFMRKHSSPNTVFTLPSVDCNQNPIYSSFSAKQTSFFFHKYWDTHGHGAPVVDVTTVENETFAMYKKRVTDHQRLGIVGRRPSLRRMNSRAVNIAVHARRGDFFSETRRTMMSMNAITNVICQIVGEVIIPDKSRFSRLPILVSIYSEGLSGKTNPNNTRDHDVNRMSKQFIDTDGKILSRLQIERQIKRKCTRYYENIFENGLKVDLRISDNTVLSIHEMIAADVFIGSNSSMSFNSVGCCSRAAFLAMGNKNSNDQVRWVLFNYSSGRISRTEISKMKQWWNLFVKNNEHSIS